MSHNLTLKVLPGRFSVCKLPADAEVPACVLNEPLFSLTRTPEEISLIVPEGRTEPGWQVEAGWRMLKVLGPLDFNLVGILYQIAEPLSKAHISIFVNSTYDTDYLMVKGSLLGQAIAALRASGIEVFWSE
ncbi:MAG: ACT domain-containing protein [Chloroflexi bacterium]|nr:ACT domain-containing protein [Chloroflexota bacterium]